MSETPPDPERASIYPIQANFIAVRELYIKAHVPPNQTLGANPDQFTLKWAHAAYDEENHVIEVGAQVEYGIESKPGEAIPYSLRAHIMGQFRIDESQFDPKKIETWARVNGPYILYPYLREHVFALTARAGFEPLLLPLLEIPTIKIELKPQSEAKAAAAPV